MSQEPNIKLTKLAHCAGCGAKVGAGVLAQLLGDIRTRHDPNLLWGSIPPTTPRCTKFPTSWPWCRRWTFSRPSPTTPIYSARSPPPTPSVMSTPWGASRNWR